MSVTTSLNSIVRDFSAPMGVDIAAWGSNHLNDMGRNLSYGVSLGAAKIYECCNKKSMDIKKEELDQINKLTKKAMDDLEPGTKSFSVTCSINGEEGELFISEAGNNSVEVQFNGSESYPLKGVRSIADLHQKLSVHLAKKEVIKRTEDLNPPTKEELTAMYVTYAKFKVAILQDPGHNKKKGTVDAEERYQKFNSYVMENAAALQVVGMVFNNPPKSAENSKKFLMYSDYCCDQSDAVSREDKAESDWYLVLKGAIECCYAASIMTDCRDSARRQTHRHSLRPEPPLSDEYGLNYDVFADFVFYFSYGR